jgi:hypothetical protein
MKKVIVWGTHILTLNTIAVILWLHILGKNRISKANFTLLIVLGIFTTLVFGEIILKDMHHDRKNKGG